MAKKTITVPKTSYDAIKRVQDLNDAIQVGEWERAIITYALWNDARPQHDSARSTDAAVGKLVGTKDRQVRGWKQRVSDHFGKDEADKLTLGSKVPTPDVPFPPMDGGNSVTADRVASKITGMKEKSDDLLKLANAIANNDVMVAAVKEILAEAPKAKETIDLYPDGLPLDEIEKRLGKLVDKIGNMRSELENSVDNGVITEDQAYVFGSLGTREAPNMVRSLVDEVENFMRQARGEELLEPAELDAEAWMKQAIGEDKLAMARTAEKAQDDKSWDEGLAALNEGSITTAPEGAEDRMMDDTDFPFDEDEDDDV